MKAAATMDSKMAVGIVNSITGKQISFFSKAKLNKRKADETRKIILIRRDESFIYFFPKKRKNTIKKITLRTYAGIFVIPKNFPITGRKKDAVQKYRKRIETKDDKMQFIIVRFLLLIFFPDFLL